MVELTLGSGRSRLVPNALSTSRRRSSAERLYAPRRLTLHVATRSREIYGTRKKTPGTRSLVRRAVVALIRYLSCARHDLVYLYFLGEDICLVL